MTSQCDDSVLLGVAILERCNPYLSIGTRVPISRTALIRIQEGCKKCIEKLYQRITNVLITGPLLEVDTLIDTLLQESTFVETDDDVKNILIGKLQPALDLLYKEAGEYYMTHEFNFKPGLESLLIRIVDKSIEQGYYFGYTEEELNA